MIAMIRENVFLVVASVNLGLRDCLVVPTNVPTLAVDMVCATVKQACAHVIPTGWATRVAFSCVTRVLMVPVSMVRVAVMKVGKGLHATSGCVPTHAVVKVYVVAMVNVLVMLVMRERTAAFSPVQGLALEMGSAMPRNTSAHALVDLRVMIVLSKFVQTNVHLKGYVTWAHVTVIMVGLVVIVHFTPVLLIAQDMASAMSRLVSVHAKTSTRDMDVKIKFV